MQLIKELYSYREMISSLVKRDLKGRYKGSVLGFFWTFLNPLLQLGVYTLVFSVILKNDIDKYYLFLFVALIPWIFFSTSVAGGANSILSQQDLVKKIYFPREVLPVSFVISQFINMLLSFIVVFLVILLSKININLEAILYLPIIMIVEFILCLGMTFITSSITVYLRDMEYILGIITMAWQFLTPIMYSIDAVPEKIKPIFYANPMTSVVISYRDILYYSRIPKLETLMSASFLGLFLLFLGLFLFKHLKRRFVEEM